MGEGGARIEIPNWWYVCLFTWLFGSFPLLHIVCGLVQSILDVSGTLDAHSDVRKFGGKDLNLMIWRVL